MRVFGEFFVQPSWLAYIDVGVVKVEPRLDIAQDRSIGLDNFSELDFDKIIERVDMLLDQSLDFEKRWQEIPFVLQLFLTTGRYQDTTSRSMSYLGRIDGFCQ